MPPAAAVSVKPKKQSPTWRIALVHFLVAIFAIPFLISFIFGSVMTIFTTQLAVSPQLKSGFLGWSIAALFLVGEVGLIALGAFLSARFINKRYVIENPSRVNNIATILLFVLYMFAVPMMYSAMPFFGAIIIYGIPVLLVNVLVFYLTGRKFLKPATP